MVLDQMATTLVAMVDSVEVVVVIHHIHLDLEDTQEQHHTIVFIHHLYRLIH